MGGMGRRETHGELISSSCARLSHNCNVRRRNSLTLTERSQQQHRATAQRSSTGAQEQQQRKFSIPSGIGIGRLESLRMRRGSSSPSLTPSTMKSNFDLTIAGTAAGTFPAAIIFSYAVRRFSCSA